MEDNKKLKYRSVVISGFPGIGKSTAAKKSKYVIDAESTGYHYEFDYKSGEMVERDDWVQKYVDFIQHESTKEKCGQNYLLVSSHKEGREEMITRGIPFVFVLPEPGLKDEYMKRYLKRGSPVEFIKYMYDNWTSFSVGVVGSPVPVIWLKSGEYLSDLIGV